MVNLVSAVRPLLHTLMKLSGLSPQQIKLGQDTIINIWAPKEAQRAMLNKPAIVLAHPFCGDSVFTWFPQVLALSSTYAVYMPDFIFFGGSTTSATERSAVFQASCLAECLGVLGVDKCTVVGLSYGGMVGFKMAELYPDLVENLVVSSTVIQLTKPISEEIFKKLEADKWADLLLPESVEGVKKTFSIGFHKLPWLPDFIYKNSLERVRFLAGTFGVLISNEVVVSRAPGFALFDNRKEKTELLEALVVDNGNIIPNYPQRIHFLWGEEDKIFNLELAQTMKEKVGDKATLKWIKNAGHLVQLERPFTYNKELKKILALFYPNSK